MRHWTRFAGVLNCRCGNGITLQGWCAAGLQKHMHGTWQQQGQAHVAGQTASCSTCTCTKSMYAMLTDYVLLATPIHAQLKEGVRGRWWFLEADCRAGQHIKLDKSGRAVLTALRALGRLQEVRLMVQGSRELVFVLCT